MLGRKIMLQKMKPIGEHCGRLYAQCRPLLMHSDSGLRRRAWSLLGHAADWQLLTYRLGLRRLDREAIAAASVDYLMLSGYVTLAAHWLRIETAVRAGGGGDADGFEEEAEFYRARCRRRRSPRTAAAAHGRPPRGDPRADERADGDAHEDFSFDHGR